MNCEITRCERHNFDTNHTIAERLQYTIRIQRDVCKCTLVAPSTRKIARVVCIVLDYNNEALPSQ